MIDFESDRRSTNRIRRLRRHARWIAAGTALCGLAALLISFLQAKIYRATTHVLVSESKMGPVVPASTWQYSLLPTYILFIDNDDLIARAIAHFHLDQEPYRLTVHRFRKRGYLDVEIPKATRLLEISVEFPDAQLAADIANYLAASAVEFNNGMNTADAEATQRFLKLRVDAAAQHLAQAEAQRLRVRDRARIEDKEKTLGILLAEKEKVSSELQQLTLASAQDESRAKSLEQALLKEPRIIPLKKSVDANRFLERAAQKLQLDGEGSLTATEETLNSTHAELGSQFAAASAEATAVRAGVKTAHGMLAAISVETNRLVGEVTRLRTEIDKAERDFTLARETYEAASRDYRNASVTVSAKSQDLKQLAPALVPERPVRPRTLLNVLLAFVLGASLLSAIAMTMESARDMQATTAGLASEEEVVGAPRS
jgi:uncharacterized protein involved in exopolysaccharide biosynthesis